MVEMFEEVFEAVCEAYSLEWYECFDGRGEAFTEVEDKIAEAIGGDPYEVPEFVEWVAEMAADL